MKNLTMKISSAVVAVMITVGGLLVPQKTYGIGSIIGFLGSELMGKVGEWIQGGDEIAKLMVLILNTQTQIDQMKGDYEKNAEKYEKWKEAIQDLKNLRDGLVQTRQVYYAAVNVSSFYRGIGNYWDYVKERGFSNFSSCIRTASEGVRLAQQVTRDAVAIANLAKGLDENGKKTEIDAYTASSRVRYLFERINLCKEQWGNLVRKDGVMSAASEEERAISDSVNNPDGELSIVNIRR